MGSRKHSSENTLLSVSILGLFMHTKTKWIWSRYAELYCIIHMSSLHFFYIYTSILQELFFMGCFLNILDVLHCWFLDYLNIIWWLCGMTLIASNHLALKTLICELWCSFLNERFIMDASNKPYESCASSRLKTKNSNILGRFTVWN